MLLYDRAGYGESTESSLDRTPQNIAIELDLLLTNLNIIGNIIFIGHSQGGLYVTQYAIMYPDKVKALILLDPATPFDGDFKKKLSVQEYKRSGVDKTFIYKLAKVLTTFKMGNLFRTMLVKSPPFCYYDFDTDSKAYLLNSLSKRKTYKTILEEYKYTHLVTTTESIINGLKSCSLQEIPIILITHSREIYVKELQKYGGMNKKIADKIEAIWQEIMKKYIYISNNSRHLTAKNSGHFIHLTDAELLYETIDSLKRID